MRVSRLTSLKTTSTKNMDLFEVIDFDETHTFHRIRKLDLIVQSPCTLVINKKSRVLLLPEYGFSIDQSTLIIDSLEIEEDGVELYAVIGY